MTLVLDTAVLSTFTLLWLAIVATPGANSLMVAHLAVTRPPAVIALAIFGNVCGVVLMATCGLLGWAALIEAFPWVRSLVQLLGGVYLIYFALRLIRRALSVAVVNAATPVVQAERQGARTFALGFFTALSNAQAIVFITSIFAVAGVFKANMATGIAVIGIIALCNASYLSFLGWMFQRPKVRAIYARYRWYFELTVGVLFGVLGGRLLFTEWVALSGR